LAPLIKGYIYKIIIKRKKIQALFFVVLRDLERDGWYNADLQQPALLGQGNLGGDTGGKRGGLGDFTPGVWLVNCSIHGDSALHFTLLENNYRCSCSWNK
jgi:hypothetical protein